MILKIKSFEEISLGVNNELPVTYDGETVGKCKFVETKAGKCELVFIIDRREDEFKKAFRQQGVSGFSMEAKKI